ncbi:MAG: PssE/Cps14G family polysaccharide biosynthesis glycosyltransferase [Bacilli bacterium]
MILVTLGTQDKSFKRLLEAIEKEITKGHIKEKVVVQAGFTKFSSKNMEIFDLIPMDKFDDLIKSCDILITHGGVGSIITGLKNGKTVIAAARLKEYGEHTNDHQLQIIKNFSSVGYILELSKMDELNAVLKKAKKFKPKKYESNTSNMVNRVGDYIDNTKQDFSLFNFLLIIFVIIIFLINIL